VLSDDKGTKNKFNDFYERFNIRGDLI